MQTIARVNRVFKDKPGGLIVDYLGNCAGTEAGSELPTPQVEAKEHTTVDQGEAVGVHAGESTRSAAAYFTGLTTRLGPVARPSNG